MSGPSEKAMSHKAYIHTFGCQMNEHDSARMMNILRAHGFEPAPSPEEASLILLNTCSVRHNPENKVYSMLGRLRPLKARNADLVIGVGGCVAQQEGESILRRERIVDMVFGPDNYFRLPEMLERVRNGERVLMTQWQPRSPDRVQNFIPDRWLEQGHVDGCKAYVAITKGCDNFCSFCIVPETRGREVSREPENILHEVRSHVAGGVREIWLLGQNVNSYLARGRGPGGADFGFYELLDAVSRVDGLKRLRFTSPHPNDWDHALSYLVAERPAICNHLHLPFQAGSDRILDLMNRRHTIREFLDKVRYLKAVVPGIEISTDLIVGFPSETDGDFARTLEVMEEVRFGLVYSFKYSPRPGTKAARMHDDVAREVKEDRLQQVIELQERINREQMDQYVGTEHEVLIDGAHPRERSVMNGRTQGYRPVAVRSAMLEVGDLVQVRIAGYSNHWLEGIPLKPVMAE